MSAGLGVVAFSTWLGVLLIVLCFGSLLIALYCLLFTVPLNSFVQRVNSLGGGMRGIRAHVDDMLSQTDRRIAEMQRLMHEGMEEGLRESRAELEQHARSVAELRADLNALHEQLADLRNDSEVLEGELAGRVRTLVSESYRALAGTVLGAHEAVRDEMLRGAKKLRHPHDPRPPTGRWGERGQSDAHRQSERKIISALPLFGDTEKAARHTGAQPDRAGADEKEQEHTPAK